ncbi:MAG: cytochrome P450 [Candidatus Dojkabacteria bacterium]
MADFPVEQLGNDDKPIPLGIYSAAECIDKPIEIIEANFLLTLLFPLENLPKAGELTSLLIRERIYKAAFDYCEKNQLPLIGIRHGETLLVYIHDLDLHAALRREDFGLLEKDPDDVRVIRRIIGDNASIGMIADRKQWTIASEIIRQTAQITDQTYPVVDKNIQNAIKEILSVDNLGDKPKNGFRNIEDIYKRNIGNIIGDLVFGDELTPEEAQTIDDFSVSVVNAMQEAQLNPSEDIDEWSGMEQATLNRQQMRQMFDDKITALFTEYIFVDKWVYEGELTPKRKFIFPTGFKFPDTVLGRQIAKLIEAGITDFDHIVDLLADNLTVAILAGTHTTYSALCSMMKHVDGNIDAVADELEALGFTGDRVPSSEEIYQLIKDGKAPELFNFTHEGLRNNGSVVVRTIRKLKKGVKVGTPFGTLNDDMKLVLPIADMGQSEIYWDKPEEFNPHRFGDDLSSLLSRENQDGLVAHFPFEAGGSRGPRVCPGALLAMLEMLTANALLAIFLKKANVTLKKFFALEMTAANISKPVFEWYRIVPKKVVEG